MLQFLVPCCLLILSACADTKLEIKLEFDASNGCLSNECEDYPLNCATSVLLQVKSTDNTVISRQCRVVSGSNLCGLADIEIVLSDLETGSNTLEIGVWNQDLLDEPTVCPSGPLFDLQGLPLPIWPPMAFGRSVPVQLGESDTIVVPLACPSTSSVTTQCMNRKITTTMRFFENQLPIDSQTANDVSIADVSISLGAQQAFATIVSVLQRIMPEPANPSWQGFGSPATPQCLQATLPHGQFLTCSNELSDVVTLPYVTVATTEGIDSSVGGIPSQGITLGIVVDPLGTPVSGATVNASGTIMYPQSDGSLGGVETDVSGTFLSLDSNFPDNFTAEKGFEVSTSSIGGNVVGNVTVLELYLGQQ